MLMSKIRKSAKGQDCLVRIPGVCNFNNETTVLAHISSGLVARKSCDIHASYCCSSCHDVIDGRRNTEYTRSEIQTMFYDGMVRTQLILIEKGLIKIGG
jgi:hypothetical protein